MDLHARVYKHVRRTHAVHIETASRLDEKKSKVLVS